MICKWIKPLETANIEKYKTSKDNEKCFNLTDKTRNTTYGLKKKSKTSKILKKLKRINFMKMLKSANKTCKMI